MQIYGQCILSNIYNSQLSNIVKKKRPSYVQQFNFFLCNYCHISTDLIRYGDASRGDVRREDYSI